MSQISGVHRACWPDKDMEKVYAERLECPSVDNQLWLIRGPDAEIIGFMHGVSEDLELDGTRVRLMRVFAAAYPEWRVPLRGFERFGAAAFIKVALRGRLDGRLPLLFPYFATPSTYRTFLRVMPRMVPAPGIEPDPKLLRLRDAAITHYGLERVPGRAHACRGPRCPMPPEARAHWQTHRAPEVRFFVDECPNFGEGEYLAGLVPMDWKDLALAPLHVCTGMVREWLRRRQRDAARR
jgi:hypothetical protein